MKVTLEHLGVTASYSRPRVSNDNPFSEPNPPYHVERGVGVGTTIELYTPGGFELFFKDFGERLRQGPIGLDELNSLGKPHGIRFFDDWIPDLKAAYNLRVIGE